MTDEGMPPTVPVRGNLPGWRTIGEAARLVSRVRIIRRTLTTAVVVGTLLSAINEGYLVARGEVSGGTWARIAANYLIPFIVANVGVLSATRR
jgi:hypothetical protein